MMILHELSFGACVMYPSHLPASKSEIERFGVDKVRHQFAKRSYILTALVRWKSLEMNVISLWLRENYLGEFAWRRGETIHVKKFGGMELIAAVNRCYREICMSPLFQDEVIFYSRSIKPGHRVPNYFLEMLTGIQSPICKDWIRDHITLRG